MALTVQRVQGVSFLCVLSVGRTKPYLMHCCGEDGRTHELVVKWRGGMETAETGLICEMMSSLLADDFDLPAPKPFVVEIQPGSEPAISNREVAEIIRKSAGLNFGSERLPSGAVTWPKDKPIPMSLRPLAAEVFAFDVLVQNVDRRRDNPNLLWRGDELYIFDHEQAFSFLMGVIGWKPPWTGQGLDFLRNHVLFQQLQGVEHSWDRLRGALDALTDSRLNEYHTVIPSEWKSQNNSADRVVEYLKQARENASALFDAINQILK